MSVEVVRLMENQQIQNFSCYSKENYNIKPEENATNSEAFKFNSAEQKDLNYMFEIKFNTKKEESLQAKSKEQFEIHTTKKDTEQEQPSLTFCSEIQTVKKKTTVFCEKRSYSEVALRILKTSSSFSIHMFFNILVWLFDLTVRLCQNEIIRDVLVVILQVSVEVFVMLVFSVSTVFATIIVKLDEGFRKRRHEAKYTRKTIKYEDEALYKKCKSVISSRNRSSKSSSTSKTENTMACELYSKSKSKPHSYKNSYSCADVIDMEKVPTCGIASFCETFSSKFDEPYLVQFGKSANNENTMVESKAERKDGCEKEATVNELCICKQCSENVESCNSMPLFKDESMKPTETAVD